MTSDDVDRIERELQIELPASYRRLVEAFPLPSYAGNVETAIWDDANRLIEYNRELRTGTRWVKPWPAHFYALGRDQGGCSQAIDLRTGDLWWADRSHLDGPGSYKHAETFEQWADDYIDGLQQDLTGEGGDPTGTPQQRAEIEARNAGSSTRALIIVVVLIVVAGILWRLLR
jgi:hypothetical protein